VRYDAYEMIVRYMLIYEITSRVTRAFARLDIDSVIFLFKLFIFELFLCYFVDIKIIEILVSKMHRAIFWTNIIYFSSLL
jgi:hypothetical protein